MARNNMAGNHPSYEKRGMDEAARKRKIAYDTKYHKSKSRIKYRSELNKINRKKGSVGDGKDVSHTKSGGTVLESQKRNRSRNGSNGKSRLK